MFVISVKFLLRANFGDFALTDEEVSEVVESVNHERPED